MANFQHSKRTSYLFNLFPKDFLKPYGLATDHIDKSMLKRRLQSFTCELLRRPGIGVSEYAATMTENLERVSNLAEIFTQTRMQNYVSCISELAGLCHNLNSKGKINKDFKERCEEFIQIRE